MGAEHAADITGRVTVRDAKRASWARDVADLTRLYLRDFYVCTKEEMRERWGNDRDLYPLLREGLFKIHSPWDDTRASSLMIDASRPLAALDSDFEGHLPLYEFMRAFWYYGAFTDRVTQKKVSRADYFLYEPLHKDVMAAVIQDKLIGPVDMSKVGTGVFESRNILKTYSMLSACSFVLTRGRVLFNDYWTIRITHDGEKQAKWRGEQVKQLFQYCRPFRALYDEMRLPQGVKHESAEEWNLVGRQQADQMTLDPQVVVAGMRSTKQGAHPDFDFGDDLEAERHMRSPASREELATYFEGLMYAAQAGTCRRLVLGTFYSPFGTHAAIVEAAKDVDDYGSPVNPLWDIILLPAVINEGKAPCKDEHCPGLLDCGNEHLAYPTRLTKQVLETMRQNELRKYGTDVFYQMQMMLRFKAAGASRFKAAMQYVDLMQPHEGTERVVARALETSTRAVFADLAQKNDETRGTGDNSAIGTVAFCYLEGTTPVRVLLDATYNDEFDINECVNEMLRQAKLYSVDYIFPEEPGQKTVGPLLHAASTERGLPYFQSFTKLGSAKTEGNIIPIVPKKQEVSATLASGLGGGRFSSWKWAIFNAFISDYNLGHWRFAKGIECIDGLVEEMSVFPVGSAKVKCDFINMLSLSYVDSIQAYLPRPKMRQPAFKRIDERRGALIDQIPGTGLVRRLPSTWME